MKPEECNPESGGSTNQHVDHTSGEDLEMKKREHIKPMTESTAHPEATRDGQRRELGSQTPVGGAEGGMGANSDSNPALAQTDGGDLESPEQITITSGSRPLQAVQKLAEHNPDVSNTGQCQA